MNSTEEIKNASRLAQQYNIHIYKYLIYGLVNSSLIISKFKVELDEYTRSTMRYYDRLYQIRDSMLPPDIVREEQINVFREQVKKNDYLRQEVHKVQRCLWNLRERGHRAPMANKHMILQGFPELCVSTSPDKVPLTDFCDQISHKYNLRNERFIMDMLRWADEQAQARKMARQTGLPSTLDLSERIFFPDVNAILDAVEKESKASEQEKKESTASDHVDDQPTTSNDGANEVTLVPSGCDFDQDKPVILTFQDMLGESFQEMSTVVEDTKQAGGMEGGLEELMPVLQDIPDLEPSNPSSSSVEVSSSTSVSSTTSSESSGGSASSTDSVSSTDTESNTDAKEESEPEKSTKPKMNNHGNVAYYPAVHKLVKSWAELTAMYPQLRSSGGNDPDKKTNRPSIPKPVKKNRPKPEDKLAVDESTRDETEDIIPDEDDSPDIQTNLSKSAQLASFTESIEEIRAKIYFQMNSSEPNSTTTAQAKELLDEMKQSSQPLVPDEESPKVLPKPKVTASTVEVESSKPDTAKVHTTVVTKPIIHSTQECIDVVRSQQQLYREPTAPIQATSQLVQARKPVLTQRLAKDQSPRPLVGSDKPHVYENRKKRVQHGASRVTADMTPGELEVFERKRDEVLQAMEIKKQRTMMLLNKQHDKNSQQKSSSLHYYQVQNTPPKVKSVTTPAVVPTRSDQISKPRSDTSASVSNSSSLTSRKRPAPSVNTGSTAPKRARSSRPRIILRIFRDKEIDDWNVEQVIDRY